MTRRRMIISALSTIFGALILGLSGAWVGYQQVGKTPGELMDYAERRLQGHNKLEAVALPVLHKIRIALDAPTVAERRATPFKAPTRPDFVPSTVAADDLTASQAGQIIRVGPGGNASSIAAASRIARDGDTIEIQAGNYYGDVTVWHQKKLKIRAVGGVAYLHANGQAAEAKAIWVFRNGDFEIDNIAFLNARVYDHNGAGIRFEEGRLIVRNCLFWNNENGILANAGKTTTVEVINSEFGYNGHGDGLSHAIYVGQAKHFKITGSYLHHSNVGHLIKSRAQSNYIAYNRITDETGGRASYEIDLPNGGAAVILGNLIQQTHQTENSTIIAYGLEGSVWPLNSLHIASNTIVNDHNHGGSFLRARGQVDQILSANNLYVGPGKLHADSSIEQFNDTYTDWGAFVRAANHDYHLSESGKSFTFKSGNLPAALLPEAEYQHSHGLRTLTQPPQFVGAQQ